MCISLNANMNLIEWNLGCFFDTVSLLGLYSIK